MGIVILLAGLIEAEALGLCLLRVSGRHIAEGLGELSVSSELTCASLVQLILPFQSRSYVHIVRILTKGA